MKERIIDVAHAIRSSRYADAVATFAAGSIVRGEGTPSSDLDLVVVHAALPHAYRESFRFGGYPVEAFVHDPDTLEYFFVDVDRPSGVPTLPRMILEGIEIPESTAASRALKRRASALIDAGPPALDAEEERRMRYFVSDLLDDLRTPRSQEEVIGAGAGLYELLADYYFRRNRWWSAKGKAIPRALAREDPALAARYGDAFNALFAQGDPSLVVALTEDILIASGGPLFEGYRADAPAAWRRKTDAV